jgi:hypothetical protein
MSNRRAPNHSPDRENQCQGEMWLGRADLSPMRPPTSAHGRVVLERGASAGPWSRLRTPTCAG